MKWFLRWEAILATGVAGLIVSGAMAQDLNKDAVTIPKSELDELKRKAAEVDQLKAEMEKLKAAMAGTNAPPQKPPPPVKSLPPLRKDEVLSAETLVGHFRTDTAAAEKRYDKKRIRVEGEISTVYVWPFVRNYTVRLRTSDRNWTVECLFGMPAEFNVIYTAKKGQRVVAETRTGVQATLAVVGDTVVIEGRCTGMKDDSVTMRECQIVPQK